MRKVSAAGAGAVPTTSQSSAKTWNRDIILTSSLRHSWEKPPALSIHRGDKQSPAESHRICGCKMAMSPEDRSINCTEVPPGPAPVSPDAAAKARADLVEHR